MDTWESKITVAYKDSLIGEFTTSGLFNINRVGGHGQKWRHNMLLWRHVIAELDSLGGGGGASSKHSGQRELP